MSSIAHVSSSSRPIGFFNIIEQDPTQHTCAFLDLQDLIQVSYVCRFFQKIVSSPNMFQAKAKQVGISLSKDQIPNNINILKLQTIRQSIKIKHEIDMELLNCNYHESCVDALTAIPMQPIPPAPPSEEDPSIKIESLFKAYALCLKNNVTLYK